MSPCLEMPPSRRRSPLEYSRGVRPSQEAKRVAESNRSILPTVARKAVLVSRPTPGIWRSCRTTSVVSSNAPDLPLNCHNALFELIEITEHLDQQWAQCSWHCLCGLRQVLRDKRARAPCSEWDCDSELTQQASQRVDIAVTSAQPLRTQAMHRQHLLLLHIFDRYCPDFPAARCLDEGRSVGAIGLTAPHVAAHVLCRQQLHRVPMPCDAARPIVRAATSLHQNATAGPLHEECREAGSIEPQALRD